MKELNFLQISLVLVSIKFVLYGRNKFARLKIFPHLQEGYQKGKGRWHNLGFFSVSCANQGVRNFRSSEDLANIRNELSYVWFAVSNDAVIK